MREVYRRERLIPEPLPSLPEDEVRVRVVGGLDPEDKVEVTVDYLPTWRWAPVHACPRRLVADYVLFAREHLARDLFLLGLGEDPIGADLFTPEDERWRAARVPRTAGSRFDKTPSGWRATSIRTRPEAFADAMAEAQPARGASMPEARRLGPSATSDRGKHRVGLSCHAGHPTVRARSLRSTPQHGCFYTESIRAILLSKNVPAAVHRQP